MSKNYLRGCVEDRIDRLSVADPISGCQYFIGSLSRDGYGMVHNPCGSRLAHRAAYEARFGPTPAGLDVLHKCDNRQCVNVGHLFVGTHTDNMRDMQAKGRKVVLKREGHPRAKLNSETAFSIRWHDAIGIKPVDNARIHGTIRQLVYQICKNQIWQQECHD